MIKMAPGDHPSSSHLVHNQRVLKAKYGPTINNNMYIDLKYVSFHRVVVFCSIQASRVNPRSASASALSRSSLSPSSTFSLAFSLISSISRAPISSLCQPSSFTFKFFSFLMELVSIATSLLLVSVATFSLSLSLATSSDLDLLLQLPFASFPPLTALPSPFDALLNSSRASL